MHFFQISNVAFEFAGYSVSYIELIGTLFGLISVYFASRTNVFTWPTGIINELFLFFLFYQVQLYADMFLQVYFFVVTVYGWYFWRKKDVERPVSRISNKTNVFLLLLILAGTIVAGFLFNNIHLYLPEYFKIKASFPYSDSYVMISSIVATVLLAKKKIETWYLWIAVDVVCVYVYFKKEVLFLSIVYFIFLILATYGLYNWRKQLKHG